MQRSDFRVGWRLLRKDGAWSLSAIAGLALGFLVCYLLLGFVLYSMSYDSRHPDQDRVFLVKTRFHFPGVPEQWSEQSTQAIRTTIVNDKLPASATMYAEVKSSITAGKVVLPLPVTLVDADFGKIMGIEALAGDLEGTLKRPDRLVLSVDSALKLFGSTETALGKIVTIDGAAFTVGALVPNPPTATTLPFAVLAGSASGIWAPGDRRDALENWGRLFGRIYVKLDAGADPAQFTAALQAASDRSPLYGQLDPSFIAQLGDKKLMDVKLVALRDAYLDPDLAAGAALHGDHRMLLGIGALALLILLLAAINYVNLATVRTLRRQREIAIVKVLGARAGEVVTQFICESVLTTMIAMVLGLAGAWVLLPLFGDLMNRQIGGLFTLPVMAGFVGIGLLTGVLAGVHPAWIAIRVRAGAALAGRGDQEAASGLWIRRALTVLQLASAIALASVTLSIAWQTYHVLSVNPGFAARSMLVIDAAPPYTEPGPRGKSFILAVKRLPGVVAVGQSLEAVGRKDIIQKGSLKTGGGAPITIEWKGVDPAFLGVYQLKPVAGRIFDEARDADVKTAGVVLSASAVRQLGFPDAQAALGQSVDDGNTSSQIIGVIADIRHQSLREEVAPVAYRLTTRAPVVTVSFSGDVNAMESAIETLWRQYFPEQVLKMARQQALLDAHYADDVRNVKLLSASALVAILIAAMGVYVLSAYNVRRRTPAIILHRLYGARTGDIVRLLGAETVALLAIAALAGIPPALLVIRHYLAGFVDYSPLWGWAIVLAFVSAVLVTFGSVWRGMAVALALRPAAVLRT